MKKQENESTKELVKDIFNPDSLFEQMVNITKAHTYDILVPQLREENEKLKERVKCLENLIDEYVDKMTANLSDGK